MKQTNRATSRAQALFLACPSRSPRRRLAPIAVAGAVALVPSAVSTTTALAAQRPQNSQVAASAKQTITISVQGLGTETTETLAQIKAFEKANPNITVKPLYLSPLGNTAYSQLTERFTAHSSTPDVIISDIIWPATFAKAGWVANLSSYHPDLSKFFPAQVKTVEYNGGVYGIPWFTNAEGLYYRTDLVKTPPKTPQQLVTDAEAAMKEDPSLKEGFAFEGEKYEGVVTAWQNFLAGFGGSLNISDIDTSRNLAALQFMYNAIYKYKISPTAVTGWEESQVQDAWLSGQTAFALNWPYLLPLSEAKGSKVAGKFGYIPFPSGSNKPGTALGGDDLVVNAYSKHQAAAIKLIDFLTSTSEEITRAIPTGDAPAVSAAYGPQLYAKAAYFKLARPLFADTVARPVNPQYPAISNDIQTVLSSVLSNTDSPKAGLSQLASELKQYATS